MANYCDIFLAITIVFFHAALRTKKLVTHFWVVTTSLVSNRQHVCFVFKIFQKCIEAYSMLSTIAKVISVNRQIIPAGLLRVIVLWFFSVNILPIYKNSLYNLNKYSKAWCMTKWYCIWCNRSWHLLKNNIRTFHMRNNLKSFWLPKDWNQRCESIECCSNFM